MKKILFLLIFCFISCGIPYDGETIITLNVRLVNANNEPIPNEKMNLRTDFDENNTDYSYFQKTSNNAGLINFTMFKPISGTTLIFEDSPEYLPVRITGINQVNFEELYWNIGTITLLKQNEIIPFSINFNQQSSNKTVEKIDLDAIKYQSDYDIATEINPFYGEFQTVYYLKKNQNFILNYEIKNTSTQAIEKKSIPLSIGSNESSYTIIY